MATTLCFDFGNTRKKCAVFERALLTEVIVLEDDSIQSIESLIQRFQPKRSILSSVVQHDPAIEELLTTRTRFHTLTPLTQLSFTTVVGRPQTIGADRLALAAAA